MATQALPFDVVSTVLEVLRDQGDMVTLEQCRLIAPEEVQRLPESVFDIMEMDPLLIWNQGKRISQFVDRPSSTSFAEGTRRVHLTTNIGDQNNGWSITMHLHEILKDCTNLNYLEVEMNPTAFDFIRTTSMWGLPFEPPESKDYVTSRLSTLKLKGFQPFAYFKLLVEGLSGSSLHHFELSGHKHLRADVGPAQNLVDLFKRKQKAFVNVTTLELGAGCDMFLMALEMMLPDLNLFPSASIFTCSPESANAVACAFAIARGMGDTLTRFEWRGLNAMPGDHNSAYLPTQKSNSKSHNYERYYRGHSLWRRFVCKTRQPGAPEPPNHGPRCGNYVEIPLL